MSLEQRRTTLENLPLFKLYLPSSQQDWEIGEQCLNSLWPSVAIWQQGSGSTLAQVMTWWLTAPSHYVNKSWPIISEVFWHSPEDNFTRNAQDIFILDMSLKITQSMAVILVCSEQNFKMIWQLSNKSWPNEISQNSSLTHCGLLTPYGIIELGKRWLR